MMPLAIDQAEIGGDKQQPVGLTPLDDLEPPGVFANGGALLFRAWLAISVTICGIIGVPFLLMGKDAVRWFCRQWARSVFLALRLLCNIRHEISGFDNLPDKPAIIAANHQSMWETLWLFAHLKKPVVVVKEELISVPIFGFWLRQTGAISVDRDAGAKSVRQLIRAAREAIKDGNQIVIFPEGTRLKPGTWMALKPGIAGIYAACKVPVTAIGHDSGLRWFYPGWQKRPGVINMQIAPSIPAGLGRDDFLAQLETAMKAVRPDLQMIETTKSSSQS